MGVLGVGSGHLGECQGGRLGPNREERTKEVGEGDWKGWLNPELYDPTNTCWPTDGGNRPFNRWQLPNCLGSVGGLHFVFVPNIFSFLLTKRGLGRVRVRGMGRVASRASESDSRRAQCLSLYQDLCECSNRSTEL